MHLQQQPNAPRRCSLWEVACWSPTHLKALTNLCGGHRRVSPSSGWS